MVLLVPSHGVTGTMSMNKSLHKDRTRSRPSAGVPQRPQVAGARDAGGLGFARSASGSRMGKKHGMAGSAPHRDRHKHRHRHI